MENWEPTFLPYVEGYDAGIGILQSAGEPRNKAIKGTADGVTITPGGSGLTTISRIDSTSDLETELGINASAKGTIGIFKSEDKFEFSNKCRIQTHSLAIVIKSEQQSGFIQIDELELTDAAKALIGTNPAGFVDQFGDCFIRGIRRGGQLYVVIRIDTRDEQSKKTIKNTLDVTVGAGFSAQAMISLNEAVKNTSSSSQILIYNIGGTAAPTNVSAPEQVANVVGPWINSVITNAAPFAVALAPYKLVTGFDPPQPEEIQHQLDILKRCEQLRYYAMDALNEIEYVLAHPKVFPGIDNAAFNIARAGLALDIDVISQARSFAARNPIQALEPESYARTKLLRPDYKLTVLPVPMPQLPPSLLKIPDLLGWDPGSLTGIQQLLANYSIDDVVNGAEYTDQGQPAPYTPRDLVEFLAAFKGEFVVDRENTFDEQGRNRINAQDPVEGSLVDWGGTVRIRAGAA